MLVSRYISKEVIKTLMVVLIVVVLLLLMNQLIRYITLAAAGNISSAIIIEVLACQTPILIGYLLPLALYLGLLLSLGRLYNDSEMTVLQACGYSQWQCLRLVLTLSALALLFAAIMALWLQPYFEWDRKNALETAVSTVSMKKIIPGRFQQLPGNQGVLYAAKTDVEHALQKVVLTKMAPKHLKDGSIAQSWDTVMAQSAQDKTIKGKHYVVFRDGSRYVGVPGQRDYDVMQFKRYALLLDAPEVKKGDDVRYWTFSYLWTHRGISPQAAAEWQWRISLPLSCLLLGVLAFCFARVRAREGKYTQLIPAMLVYVFYMNLLFLSRAWLLEGRLPVAIGLWWVHGFILLLALLLLYRQYRWTWLPKRRARR